MDKKAEARKRADWLGEVLRQRAAYDLMLRAALDTLPDLEPGGLTSWHKSEIRRARQYFSTQRSTMSCESRHWQALQALDYLLLFRADGRECSLYKAAVCVAETYVSEQEKEVFWLRAHAYNLHERKFCD